MNNATLSVSRSIRAHSVQSGRVASTPECWSHRAGPQYIPPTLILYEEVVTCVVCYKRGCTRCRYQLKWTPGANCSIVLSHTKYTTNRNDVPLSRISVDCR